MQFSGRSSWFYGLINSDNVGDSHVFTCREN